MDLILLDTSGHLANPEGGPDSLRDAPDAPPAPEGGVPAPGIYAPPVRAEFKRIIGWFNELGVPPRVFAWMPEVAPGQTDCFADLMCELTRDGQALPVCIVQLRFLTPAVFERLLQRGLRQIVIHDDPAIPVDDAIARVNAGRKHLEDLRRDEEGNLRRITYAEQYTLSLWLAPGAAPGNFRRTGAYQRSGIPWESISVAPFALGAAPGDLVPAEETLPGHEDGLRCQLFDNSLTIDSDLSVLPCPRYSGTGGTIAGKFYQQLAEELMIEKGRRSLTIGCTELCVTCSQWARFRWEKARPAIVDEFVTVGRQEGKLKKAPPVPNALAGKQFDLAAADPDQQAAELAAFEKSLDDWAASMADLDDTPPQDGPKAGQ